MKPERPSLEVLRKSDPPFPPIVTTDLGDSSDESKPFVQKIIKAILDSLPTIKITWGKK